jgi:hypothetical protein
VVHLIKSGIASMPLMSPLIKETQARAFAVRKLLRHFESMPDASINAWPGEID